MSQNSKTPIAVVAGLGALGVAATESSCKKVEEPAPQTIKVADTTYIENNTFYDIVNGDTSVIKQTDTVDVIKNGTDTVYIPGPTDTIVINNGDTTYHGGGTTNNIIACTTGGLYGAFEGDPQAVSGTQADMNAYGLIAVNPGYYYLPGTPSTSANTIKHGNEIATISLGAIDTTTATRNGYYTNLIQSLQAIPSGVITSSLYPGETFPNFALPEVQALYSNLIITAGKAMAGFELHGLEQITNIANHTGNAALQNGALAVTDSSCKGLADIGNYVIYGWDFPSTLGIDVGGTIARQTHQLGITVNFPPGLGDKNYYVNNLAHAMNTAPGAYSIYAQVDLSDTTPNTPATMHAADRFLDTVGTDVNALTGGNTPKFYRYTAADKNLVTVSDLTANQEVIGTEREAGGKNSKPHIHIPLTPEQAAKIHWYPTHPAPKPSVKTNTLEHQGEAVSAPAAGLHHS